MRASVSNVLALAVGVVSFVLTIGLVMTGRSLIGLDLFSLMLWGIIPAGAFLIGLFAASGYYWGAVKFHVKPTRGVAVGMFIVAALVQVTLYYLQYTSATLEDGQAISAFVSFPRFVGWMLSHSQYGGVMYGYRPEGLQFEVGFLGYVIAIVQFVALIIGGLAVYAFLADKPYCDTCGRFGKRISMLALPFSGDMAIIETLRKQRPLSSSYFDALGVLPAGNLGRLELQVSRCEKCGREALTEHPIKLKEDGTNSTWDSTPRRTMWGKPGASLADHLAKLRPAS